MKEKLNTLETKLVKDCTTLTATSGLIKAKKSSVTVESARTNKGMTSKGKSSTCKTSIGKRPLLKTSGVASTTKGRDLTEYWNDSCLAKSSHLWLPTKTALQDLERNLSSTWLNVTVENSWFSTTLHALPKKNLQTTCLTSYMSSLVECTDSASTLVKSKKIRIYPNKEQRKLFKFWLSVARKVYNDTIWYLNHPDTKANWMAIKVPIIETLPEWAKDVPYQIKSMAVKQACLAVKQAKIKCKETGQFNKVSFMSRKESTWSCYIPKSAVKNSSIYGRLAGQLLFKEQLPSDIRDSRLVLHYDQWYLCVPSESTTVHSENQGRIVALDPGVRTFQTFYSNNSCGKLGDGDFSRIVRLAVHLDDLLSRSTKVTSKKRRSMKKAANRIRIKIRNLVDELHHKVSHFLVKNFDVILLPTFETSQMSNKLTRKIGRKSVRSMLTFAHYRFKQFIKHKAFEFGKVVLDVNEAYTSKTVSWTGEVIRNLGGRKVVKSRKTGLVMDRDYNGARGIFLRALVDTPNLAKLVKVSKIATVNES